MKWAVQKIISDSVMVHYIRLCILIKTIFASAVVMTVSVYLDPNNYPN